MKHLVPFLYCVFLIWISVLTGCTSSGSNVDHLAISEPQTTSDSVQIADGIALLADTLATAPEDTVTTDSTITTITGETEEVRRNRPELNVIDVNGDGTVGLDDYLRTVAGVRVVGQRENASIRIRGITTMSSPLSVPQGVPGAMCGNCPLFIIDGVQFGRDFREVYNYVDLNQVREIRIIKGPEQAHYGSQGAAGVIIINRFSARNTRE